MFIHKTDKRIHLSRRMNPAFAVAAFLFCGVVAAKASGVADSVTIAELSITHRMMQLVMQVGVILFAARLGNMLFERIRQPGVLGEIIAGILIGPYVLGGIPLPGFAKGLFPLFSVPLMDGGMLEFVVTPELYGICALASVVLLFLVGLETDVTLLLRYSFAGSLVGLGGVVFSYLAGNLTGVWLLPWLTGNSYSMLSPACIFLGVMSTATSVGITARVLSEKRKLDSPEGVTILAGAVIDDVFGIVLLAVAMGVIAASDHAGRVDWLHIGQIAVKAVGIWLVATALGLRFARRISGLLKSFRDQSVIAMLALSLALIVAALFEEARLAMIIGAYVTGMSLARTDISHVIRERLQPIHAFIVPVFFTVMGMMVDPAGMLDKRVILFGLLYSATAFISKLAGCSLPALLCGFNRRGALRVGLGMLPRGEVALIIAGIGLASGYLSTEIFGIGVMMTLITTMLAPPLLVGMMSGDKSGVRHPVVSDTAEPQVFQFPSIQATEILRDKLLTVFRQEGFFVHVLNRHEGVYQLRKDKSIINLRQHENELIFDSHKQDVSLINAAMMEVIAEFEKTVAALRKPIDRNVIVQRLQESVPTGASEESIKQFLRKEWMVPRLEATDKAAVIGEMLDVLVKDGVLSADVRDDAYATILERESSMSTGMQHGIAVPHGRTDCVNRLLCVVGLKPGGVDFDSMDGKPARIIVLTLSPLSVSAPQVRFMSMISQRLTESVRRALLVCDNAADMYELLCGEGVPRHAFGRGKAVPLTVKDVVKPEYMAVPLQSSGKQDAIHELLMLLKKDGVLHNPAMAEEDIMARENSMSTGLDKGIAIPHARTEAVSRLVCAIGISGQGIDFDTMDGQPARIIVLTLSPVTAVTPHVQVMALLSRLLTAERRKKMLAAANAAELYRILVASA